MDELSEENRLVVARARKIQRFFSQSFFVAEQFTGNPGTYVKLSDTIRSFQAIIHGEVDEIPERFFMYKATIEDVKSAYALEGAKEEK